MVFTQTINGTQNDDELGGADEGDDFIYGRGGNDLLSGFGRHDRLFGGPGDDILYGGAGTDILDGGSGADYLDGGTSFDYADYGASRARVIITLAGGAGTGSGGAAQGDTLLSIEGIFGSAFGDVMYGGRGSQSFAGLGGNDMLFGGAGADTLDGGDGDDKLFGEAGDDILEGGAGADTIDGGAGFDMAAYFGGEAVVDMLHPDRNTGAAAGDVLFGIEGIYGSHGADRLMGDDSDNTLIGNGGADVIYGRGGNDVLRGGGPDARLYGGDGDDVLQEGAGILNGGAGNDSINVRIGNYVEFDGLRMRGGEGSDVFHTNVLDNSVVRIIDFEPGVDTLDLFFRYAYMPNGQLNPKNFVLGTAAVDGNDHIIYDQHTGRLWFDENGGPGGDDQFLIAVLTNHANLSAADILV